MRTTIIIPGMLPNLNDYTKANRSNKFAGANMKKKTEVKITKAIIEHNPPKFKGKTRLSFRWFEQNKRRDLDNICFAKKFILDALVKNEILETDDWRGVIGFTDTFFTDPEYPRIEVDIEEAEE